MNITTRTASTLVSHVPCCGAAATMSYFGIQFNMPHSLEAGIATVTAIAAHEVIHKVQNHFSNASCCEDENDGLAKKALKRVFIPASLGLAVWGGTHVIGAHNHESHEEVVLSTDRNWRHDAIPA